jgi:hypothetical protein
MTATSLMKFVTLYYAKAVSISVRFHPRWMLGVVFNSAFKNSRSLSIPRYYNLVLETLNIICPCRIYLILSRSLGLWGAASTLMMLAAVEASVRAHLIKTREEMPIINPRVTGTRRRIETKTKALEDSPKVMQNTKE